MVTVGLVFDDVTFLLLQTAFVVDEVSNIIKEVSDNHSSLVLLPVCYLDRPVK